MILVKENKTWEEALEHCRASSYELVSVQPGEDHRTMMDYVMEAKTDKVGSSTNEPGPAQGLSLLKGSFSLPRLLVGGQFWVSVKHKEAVWTVTDSEFRFRPFTGELLIRCLFPPSGVDRPPFPGW